MYVDVSHIRQGDKTYTRYLLRESFRDNGKVKHRTIANLSSCSAAEIEANGPRCGAVWRRRYGT
jgi:hypothetical protein